MVSSDDNHVVQQEQASTEDMHADLVTVHDSMLDGLGQLSDYFGFSKVMGQLYAALLLSPEPLSLDDMMTSLGISKASVSMHIRTLEHMGMVRQVWLRGKSGRRKYYEAETDFIQIITNLLSGREMRDVERAITVMQENTTLLKRSQDLMNDDDRKRADLYMERMTQMESLFRFAQLVITTILDQVAHMDLSEVSRIEIE